MTEATRLGVACGASESGALAFEADGGTAARVVAGGAGTGAGAGCATGSAAAAVASSARTISVLILRGSVPPTAAALPPLAASLLPGATLAVDGGLAFWFSGGNTTRGPALAISLTSTGCSSRETSFSAALPAAIRS